MATCCGTVPKVPFSFDLNTAGHGLKVSTNLNSVARVLYSSFVATADRFSFQPGILGSTAFSKGQHSWQVDLGGNKYWRVGVVKQSIDRNSITPQEAKNGYWYLHRIPYDESTEYRVSNCCLTRVKPGIELKRILVELDYEEGELSFYDGEHKSHLFTFHEKFSGDLIPYFYIEVLNFSKSPKWLTICPLKICI